MTPGVGKSADPNSQKLKRRAARPKRATGRPSIFTGKIATAICIRLADGESLRRICADEKMPNKSTVFKWLADPALTVFHDQYARAREAQADTFVDDMVDIADDTSNDTIDTESGERANAEWISRSKVRIETRKWIAARMQPKKYGDKLELGGSGGGGAIEVVVKRFGEAPEGGAAHA